MEPLHLTEDTFVPADAGAVAADGAGIVAAEGAMEGQPARGEHRVMSVTGEVVETAVDDGQVIEAGDGGPAASPRNAAGRVAQDQAGEAVEFAPLFEAPDQLPDNRLRFTANHRRPAVRHQVFGEKIGVDAPGQEADAGVELAQTANLGASDRVVRRDDREPTTAGPNSAIRLKNRLSSWPSTLWSKMRTSWPARLRMVPRKPTPRGYSR